MGLLDGVLNSAFCRYFTQEYFHSLWTVSLYFVLVLGGTWLWRQISFVTFKNDKRKQLNCSDFLLWHQVGMCAFGEFEIFQKYGYVAFFISIVVNMTISLKLNGKACNLFLVHEEYLNKRIAGNDAHSSLATHFFGGGLSVVSSFILRKSVNFHTGMAWKPACCLLPDFLVNSPVIFLIQLFGGFLFRIIFIRIDNDRFPRRIHFLPFVYATFFTATLYMIRIPGLELAMDISRMPTCVFAANNSTLTIAYLFAQTPFLLGWWLHSKMTPTPVTLKSAWVEISDEEGFAEKKAKEEKEAARRDGVIAPIPEGQQYRKQGRRRR